MLVCCYFYDINYISCDTSVPQNATFSPDPTQGTLLRVSSSLRYFQNKNNAEPQQSRDASVTRAGEGSARRAAAALLETRRRKRGWRRSHISEGKAFSRLDAAPDRTFRGAALMFGEMNARVRRPGTINAARSACGGSECALLFSPGMAAALCLCVCVRARVCA